MSGLMPPFPLSYDGQVAVPFINKTFPPTTDFNNFNVPTIWTDTANENAYVLVSKPLGVANWVLIGGMPGQVATLTGNSGGAVPPTAGNINVVGDSTTITVVGVPGTSTLTISTVGPYASTYNENTGSATPISGIIQIKGQDVLTTTGSTNLVTIATTLATDGQLMIGSTASPHAKLGNITSTGGTLSITNGSGTINLESSAFRSVVTQVFTSSGTYTPTSGMKYCIVEVVGGGGGGAGADASGAATVAAGGGGGSGGYSRKTISAATIGVSQTVTIGAGGAGAAAGNNNGTSGGTTTFGAIISCTGGAGGSGSGAAAATAEAGGAGGTGSGGDVNTSGNFGLCSIGVNLGVGFVKGGDGGSSFFGGNGEGGRVAGSSQAGQNATSYGGGGGGGASGLNSAAAAGGNGFAGIVVVTEFV